MVARGRRRGWRMFKGLNMDGGNRGRMIGSGRKDGGRIRMRGGIEMVKEHLYGWINAIDNESIRERIVNEVKLLGFRQISNVQDLFGQNFDFIVRNIEVIELYEVSEEIIEILQSIILQIQVFKIV